MPPHADHGEIVRLVQRSRVMIEQALDLRDHRRGMFEARQLLDDLPVALVGKSSMMMVVRAIRKGLFESVQCSTRPSPAASFTSCSSKTSSSKTPSSPPVAPYSALAPGAIRTRDPRPGGPRGDPCDVGPGVEHHVGGGTTGTVPRNDRFNLVNASPGGTTRVCPSDPTSRALRLRQITMVNRAADTPWPTASARNSPTCSSSSFRMS